MENEHGRALLITCTQTFHIKGKNLKAHSELTGIMDILQDVKLA